MFHSLLVGFRVGLLIYLFSIHNLVYDVSFFVVNCSLPFFTILQFPYILVSIWPSICSLTIWYSVLPFTIILSSIRKSFCSLTWELLGVPLTLLRIKWGLLYITFFYKIICILKYGMKKIWKMKKINYYIIVIVPPIAAWLPQL